MAGYVFAPGVSGCIADGRLVVLNVHADRYLMFPPQLEASMFRLLRSEPDAGEDRMLRDRLCIEGLVLQRRESGVPALCQHGPPSKSLVDTGWPRPGIVALASAAGHVLRTNAILRLSGLDSGLERVACTRPVGGDDPGCVPRIAAAFADLRLLIPSLDRCLPLSLALAAAAKRHDEEVRLVLGVQCDPFGAHAWVQRGPTVLNDRLDAVRAFTPILVL